jgi:tRNA(fMet)-specific endonuclease VapC
VIVLDTDVLIDALGGEEPWAGFIAARLPTRRLATTSVTRCELLAGARSEDEAMRIRTLLGPMAILPFDREAADRAAGEAARLQAEGRPLPMADLAIAGICLELGASLLTRNRRHFERIDGLKLEEPG